MKRLGQEERFESLAVELGRSRVREVRESSGRLPPKAKYWFPSDGIVAASALRFLVRGVREGNHSNRSMHILKHRRKHSITHTHSHTYTHKDGSYDNIILLLDVHVSGMVSHFSIIPVPVLKECLPTLLSKGCNRYGLIPAS